MGEVKNSGRLEDQDFSAVAVLYRGFCGLHSGVAYGARCIRGIIAGEMLGMKIGPELLLGIAIMVLVPLVMAVLSLTLKDSTNRWANIILGIVFTGLRLIELIEHLSDPTAHGILMIISTIVAPALIVWYAWKSKKEA